MKKYRIGLSEVSFILFLCTFLIPRMIDFYYLFTKGRYLSITLLNLSIASVLLPISGIIGWVALQKRSFVSTGNFWKDYGDLFLIIPGIITGTTVIGLIIFELFT